MLVPSYYLNSIAAPLRPTTTLNTQAAARFIGHSLSHLTSGTYLNIKFMCIFRLLWLGSESFFVVVVVVVAVSDQKRSMQAISRGERRGWSGQKRKPEPFPEKKSVRAAAEEFLAKAAQELIGNSDNRVKGPVILISDEDED
jgi:exosome complex protein LRP1